MTYAKIETKNNDYGINGIPVKVVEVHQNFITCQFLSRDDERRFVTADFGKSEVVKMWRKVYLGSLCQNIPLPFNSKHA